VLTLSLTCRRMWWRAVSAQISLNYKIVIAM
jgi:hypothetical protein